MLECIFQHSFINKGTAPDFTCFLYIPSNVETGSSEISVVDDGVELNAQQPVLQWEKNSYL